MSVCLCYHDEQNFLHECGVCYGTKEKEPCSCGGNPVKCDFYEEVRKKYFHQTNADRIRAMTDEELAEFMKPYDSGCHRWNGKEPMPCSMRTNCRDCWLDWLKSPVEEN